MHIADECVSIKHTPTHTHTSIETMCRLPLGGESWEQKTKGRRKRRALAALGGVGVTESSEEREREQKWRRKEERKTESATLKTLKWNKHIVLSSY